MDVEQRVLVETEDVGAPASDAADRQRHPIAKADSMALGSAFSDLDRHTLHARMQEGHDSPGEGHAGVSKFDLADLHSRPHPERGPTRIEVRILIKSFKVHAEPSGERLTVSVVAPFLLPQILNLPPGSTQH